LAGVIDSPELIIDHGRPAGKKISYFHVIFIPKKCAKNSIFIQVFMHKNNSFASLSNYPRKWMFL